MLLVKLLFKCYIVVTIITKSGSVNRCQCSSIVINRMQQQHNVI